MDNMFETGLAKRKATLGAEYVDGVFENADEFSRPFQEAMTAWCWGFGWGDEAIDAKTRSMMNLAMIGALGKMHEWELHCRGAIGNGVTKEELRAIVHVIGIYCGVPQAMECLEVCPQSVGRGRALAQNQKSGTAQGARQFLKGRPALGLLCRLHSRRCCSTPPAECVPTASH